MKARDLQTWITICNINKWVFYGHGRDRSTRLIGIKLRSFRVVFHSRFSDSTGAELLREEQSTKRPDWTHLALTVLPLLVGRAATGRGESSNNGGSRGRVEERE